MENPEAKLYRAGLIKDLQSLKAKKENWRAHLVSSQKTDRYAEAKQIQTVVRKEKQDAINVAKLKPGEQHAKTDSSMEQTKSPEQLAAEIIEAINTDPNIEFAVDGVGNILSEGGGGGIKNYVVGTRTGGKLQLDRSNDALWIGIFERGEEDRHKYFEPVYSLENPPSHMGTYHLSPEKMKRLFLVRRMKISTPQAFSKLFTDTRRGITFTIALSASGDEKKIDTIQMPELREFFKTRKWTVAINGKNIDKIFDLLAMHYIPDYFQEMQRLAAEYKKHPWRT